MRKERTIGTMALLLGLSLTALADDDECRRSYYDRPRAAPAPAQLLLIAGGLTLVGIYVAWRQQRSHAKNVS
jgi:hypothetical protein